MKRITIIILLAGLILFLCSCTRTYRINVIGGNVDSCPKSAKAGETVTVTIPSVTDGSLEASVTGAEVERTLENSFQFVMPDHDVDVRVVFVGDDFS